jgi:Ca2+-binding RTX toxin-like protein
VVEAVAGGVDLEIFKGPTGGALGANVENGKVIDGAGILGNALDNILYAGLGSSYFNGGAGNDTVSYALFDSRIAVNLSYSSGFGQGKSDSFTNIENIDGSAYNDSLIGNLVGNRLDGGAGDDVINGANGKDTLTGGAGADHFAYTLAGQSNADPASWDVITDFSHAQGDLIDLAQLHFGQPAYTFIGSAQFSADATGQLRYDQATGMVYLSTDADADAELAIQLLGAPTLVASDFVL